jgi:hypothetical protein
MEENITKNCTDTDTNNISNLPNQYLTGGTTNRPLELICMIPWLSNFFSGIRDPALYVCLSTAPFNIRSENINMKPLTQRGKNVQRNYMKVVVNSQVLQELMAYRC